VFSLPRSLLVTQSMSSVEGKRSPSPNSFPLWSPRKPAAPGYPSLRFTPSSWTPFLPRNCLPMFPGLSLFCFASQLLLLPRFRLAASHLEARFFDVLQPPFFLLSGPWRQFFPSFCASSFLSAPARVGFRNHRRCASSSPSPPWCAISVSV